MSCSERQALTDLEFELNAPHTQDEIAKHLKLSQQKVSYIERRALAKLRALLEARGLGIECWREVIRNGPFETYSTMMREEDSGPEHTPEEQIYPWLCKTKIYFVQAEQGPIKIGFAEDVDTRVANLQCGNPFGLRLLGTIPGGRFEEKALHFRFRALRMRGEWFHPAPDLVSYISANAR